MPHSYLCKRSILVPGILAFANVVQSNIRQSHVELSNVEQLSNFLATCVLVLFFVVIALFLLIAATQEEVNWRRYLKVAFGGLVLVVLGVLCAEVLLWLFKRNDPIFIFIVIVLALAALLVVFFLFLRLFEENETPVFLAVSALSFLAPMFPMFLFLSLHSTEHTWWNIFLETDLLEKNSLGNNLLLWTIIVAEVFWIIEMVTWWQWFGSALWEQQLLRQDDSRKRWKIVTNFIILSGVVLSTVLLGLSAFVAGENVALMMLITGMAWILSLLEFFALGEDPQKIRLYYSRGLPEKGWLVDADQKFYYIIVAPHPRSQAQIKIDTRPKDEVKRIVFLKN